MNPTIKINPDNTVTVALTSGTFVLREPIGKDMDGMGQDLIKIKHTDTVQKLLSRIATPSITRAMYGKLTLPETQALNVAIDFFSASPNAKAEMHAALTELGYLSESDSEPTNLLQ
ncbi:MULTISPECIES: hypothetical protein [Kingella]|uniref:hypothetical protein n=1 Tax=Kingella TaxID=32257 RepID=UPI00050A1D78|nr:MULTISPECIES: hypothetical protein [Kingella]MDK4530454.1 hypothetical protein [Kingella kingae]MDK4580950.1 hypothetical protein [Kingella kingae]MDK4687839.1 hypothetical protein [Kingella negevensis]WII91166.1 hypothetical protein QEO93_00795 [Kingella negevensis]